MDSSARSIAVRAKRSFGFMRRVCFSKAVSGSSIAASSPVTACTHEQDGPSITDAGLR
jgi:hypothetical protein